jgi:hypothetical protein
LHFYSLLLKLWIYWKKLVFNEAEYSIFICIHSRVVLKYIRSVKFVRLDWKPVTWKFNRSKSWYLWQHTVLYFLTKCVSSNQFKMQWSLILLSSIDFGRRGELLKQWTQESLYILPNQGGYTHFEFSELIKNSRTRPGLILKTNWHFIIRKDKYHIITSLARFIRKGLNLRKTTKMQLKAFDLFQAGYNFIIPRNSQKLNSQSSPSI